MDKKGEIVLFNEMSLGGFDDGFDFELEEFDVNASSYDFSLSIYVDDKHTLENQLKNRKAFDKCNYYWNNSDLQDDEITRKILDSFKFVSDNFDNIFKYAEFIKLNFKENEILDYIKNNKLIQSKKIVLPEILDITDERKIVRLLKKYKDYINNIYVSLNGNTNYASLKDCYKTIKEIKRISNSILSLGLSPMETIMYTYDLVRSRVYTEVLDGQELHLSRDLTSSMFGKNIVCVGYANIFDALLHYMGFRSQVVYLDNAMGGNEGHARNVAYVKDNKHNIDGVYYFDPTYDSRRDNEYNEYLDRYIFFANTKEMIDKFDDGEFIDNWASNFGNEFVKMIEDFVSEKDYIELLKYRMVLNNISKLVIGERLINSGIFNYNTGKFVFQDKEQTMDFDEISKKLKYIYNRFNKEISAETMIKILNNVRKVEYYQNPDFYPYNLNSLFKAVYFSDWKFKENHLNPEKALLANIFGQEPKLQDKFIPYCRDNGIYRDVQGVKLAKTLRKVLEKKIDNK